MPELPEVETTRRGIAPLITGKRVTRVVVRQAHLRHRVPPRLATELPGQHILAVERRAKYLLLRSEQGTVLVHLGMSGSLRLTDATSPPRRHDHLDIEFADGTCLRLHDPRRFGLVLWTRRDPLRHRLLSALGPEPLSAAFDGDYLYSRARGRKGAVKQFLMNGHIVAGIGNIYANEALFRAGIDPRRPAGRISRARYHRLAAAVKATLQDALAQGGTTLRDYRNGVGEPGRFRLRLDVYERAGQPCRRCASPIRRTRQGQRATYFCPRCQH